MKLILLCCPWLIEVFFVKLFKCVEDGRIHHLHSACFCFRVAAPCRKLQAWLAPPPPLIGLYEIAHLRFV